MATDEKKAGLPTTQETTGALPAYLQGKQKAGLANLDVNDLILPRIKLMQAISPEVLANEKLKVGMFIHNVLGEPLGEDGGAFRFIIISMKKKYLLMAPMGDQRGVLARAEDGVNWSPPDAAFEVKLKGVKESQKWSTKPTVRESGLAEFGSSIPGDPDSKPAAVLIYEYLIYLPDFPHLSPIVMSCARSAAKKGKDLNSKIQYRAAPLAGMVFKAIAVDDQGDEGPFKNYMFQNDGWATEEEFATVEALATKFAGANYKVHDEEGAARGDHEADDGKPKEY